MPSLQGRILKKTIQFALWLNRKRKKDFPDLRQMLEKIVKKRKLPDGIHIREINIDGIHSELLTPDGIQTNNIILYLHGGGYFAGSGNTHRRLAASIARASNARVLLPEYRLFPQHTFPAPVEDALKTYHWLLHQNINASSIILAGDSAGGGLSIALALSLRDNSESLPAAIICLSPWVDLKGTADSYATRAKQDPILKPIGTRRAAEIYAGKYALDNPLISPVYGDLSGLPPMLIHVGTDEILHDEALALGERARTAGVDVTIKVWPGMWHVFQIVGKYLPECRKSIKEIAEFATKHFDDAI